jgi:hypothetical protein
MENGKGRRPLSDLSNPESDPLRLRLPGAPCATGVGDMRHSTIAQLVRCQYASTAAVL